MTSNALIGCSPQFRTIIEEIDMVAPLDCSVLIQGETGTGKEGVARAIHERGRRRNGPFVALNCAAIPSPLLESELFGHEKGAFTGAIAQTTGKFLAAHGGTLFLDEIGDLTLELQPKLLRVLQEQQVQRLGSTRTTHVDVRIIAATNLHLPRMVEERQFRADLYYRLNVFPLILPPLRERQEDIPLLTRHFVNKFAAQMGRTIAEIPDEVMRVLTRHDWPGNIRELQNFVERAVIMTTGYVLNPRLAELELMASPTSRFDGQRVSGIHSLTEVERAHIVFTLAQTNWVVGGRDGAAARLGLPRTTLISRMQRLGISRAPGEQSNLRIMRRNASSSGEDEAGAVGS
jgi:transcriptional regulator with GAF, ATPase, and Fis domain